jgi:hypothetical protein
MAQHVGDDLRVHSTLEKQCRRSVPEIVETDLWQFSALEESSESARYVSRSVRGSDRRREDPTLVRLDCSYRGRPCALLTESAVSTFGWSPARTASC